MVFKDYLNSIYEQLGCSQVELSKESGLSAPVISRYLSGSRQPAIDSDQIKALALGLSSIAKYRSLTSPEMSYDNILNALTVAINQANIRNKSFVINFNALINCFDINIKDMALATNFDVSYIYKVRSGERHPVDLNKFCALTSDYISKNYCSPDALSKASQLFGCSESELFDSATYISKLSEYLTSLSYNSDLPSMSGFLKKMDEFNLDEYIKVIHFDELKVPTMPFHLPSSKYYYGVEDMRNAELDFFKSTVLGKSMDSVFMCSHMPMLDLAEDMEFNKKWMFAIAMSIKKGLHLNVVHNLDRPMEELMLGFEAWIPIYMTGQVSPYHLPDYESNIYNQINYCSGSAALYGECIDGHYADGKYYVTNNKTELKYYRKKAENILANAKPLMDIFTEESKEMLDAFLEKNKSLEANHHIIDSSLPFYTLPKSLLDQLISGMDEPTKACLKSYYNKKRKYAETVLSTNTITYDIKFVSKEKYEKSPMILSFPDLFIDTTISLSYEEYILHLEATKAYANTHTNFIINYVDEIPFTNIKITAASGKYIHISKCKCPNIHFVIYHPKMVAAMENFYIARQD